MFPALLSLALIAQVPSTPELTPHPPEHPDQSIRLLRAPLETLAGVGMGITAGLVTTALVCAISGGRGGEELPPCVGTFFIVGGLAMPLGTYLVGNWLDGDGSLLASYGGLAAAGLITGALALILGNHFDDGPVPADVSIALFLIAPTIGYELTSPAHRSHLQVLPTVSPKSAGLALVGTF